MSAGSKGGSVFCFRSDKRGEEGGHDREWIGIGSGEGDDERKGHSFGEVNVNSKQCSGASSPPTHRSRSLDADVFVIDLGWTRVGTYDPNVGEMDIHSPVIPVKRT